tara:strand:- start:1071 stop:1598 length:528 start_codon:yes stop_codon:yes gene_type:complete
MPEVKDKTTGQVIAKMPYDTAGKMAAEKMVAENPGYEIKDGAQRSEQMYAGGGKTGYSQIGVRGDMPTGPDLPPDVAGPPGAPDLPIPSMGKGGEVEKEIFEGKYGLTGLDKLEGKEKRKAKKEAIKTRRQKKRQKIRRARFQHKEGLISKEDKKLRIKLAKQEKRKTIKKIRKY